MVVQSCSHTNDTRAGKGCQKYHVIVKSVKLQSRFLTLTLNLTLTLTLTENPIVAVAEQGAPVSAVRMGMKLLVADGSAMTVVY